jgi:chromate transporter
MKDDILWQLGFAFLFTAIISVGGISTMIPEIHRQIVETRGWMTNEQFATAFAISQVAPGPNILMMTMMGWRIAGWAGLTVATLATIIPTSIIALMAGRAEERIEHARWYAMTKRALPPLVVGLICASALITAQAAITDWLGVVLAAGVALFMATTRSNPLVPLSVAVVIGIVAARFGYF